MRHLQQETEQTKEMAAKTVVIAEGTGQKHSALEKRVQKLEKNPLDPWSKHQAASTAASTREGTVPL